MICKDTFVVASKQKDKISYYRFISSKEINETSTLRLTICQAEEKRNTKNFQGCLSWRDETCTIYFGKALNLLLFYYNLKE